MKVSFPILTMLFFCFACSLGCGESEKEKNPNPSLGDINTPPLPKRDGVKSAKEGKGPQKK